ncbi:hypothetical protein GCM10027360_45720 [Amycolatopsis echigonensis]
MQFGGGQAQQGGLAGPVGPEHHPSLVQLDRPVEGREEVVSGTADADTGHPHDEVVRIAGQDRLAHAPIVAVARARARTRPGVTARRVSSGWDERP